jgi:3-hydroxymyristoyl/3-hydroxydecanoyl-(acyl carrier protein) dehydratase
MQVLVCIAADHPALAGHFPGYPIVPGAVLLDEVLHALDAGDAGGAGWRIDAVKFHRPVHAGQQLQLQCRHVGAGGHTFELRADELLYISGTVHT